MAEDLVITLPNEPLKPLSALWSRCETSATEREQRMSKGSGYLLYEIVDTMYDYCFPILDKIGFKLDSIEDAHLRGPQPATTSCATSRTSSRRSSTTAAS